MVKTVRTRILDMKHFFSRYLLILLLPLISAVAQAQTPEVSASLSTSEILIGDQIPLTLDFRNLPEQGSVVVWPNIPDSVKGWEVVDTGKVDTIRKAGTMTLQQQLIITSFDSGSHQIPAFEFRFVINNQSEQSLRTESLQLLVNTIPVDTTQPFKAIKDIVSVEQPGFLNKSIDWIKSNKWLIFGIIVALLLLAGLIYYLLKRKQQNLEASQQESPVEKALRLLNELEASHYYEQGRIKEHYSLLGDIIREYLDERFQLTAMEQTTNELLAAIKRHSELRKIRPELKRLLRTADLAKFAKANPLPDEHRACLEAAYTIINTTKPIEITAESDQ
jgi:hypothetical protein